MNETTCADCGMSGPPGEFHPYAVCLMFKACRNSETVRANLAFVMEHGAATERAAREALANELSAARTRILVLEREVGTSEDELSALRSRCGGLASKWSGDFRPDFSRDDASDELCEVLAPSIPESEGNSP